MRVCEGAPAGGGRLRLRGVHVLVDFGEVRLEFARGAEAEGGDGVCDALADAGLQGVLEDGRVGGVVPRFEELTEFAPEAGGDAFEGFSAPWG